MRMPSGFLLTRCCLNDKAPFIYKYKLSQKEALSTLNIFKIVIILKSQVLSKEDIYSSLVAHRQTCNQVFSSSSKLLNTGQTHSPPELLVLSKVTTTYFLCVTNLDCFDLVTPLKKVMFEPRQ